MDKKMMRLNALIDLLKSRKAIPIRELASKLGVSEMTIRRDLDTLAGNHIAENVHGVAVYNEKSNLPVIGADYEWSDENSRHADEKTRIGRFAASLIEPNDVVIIDVGSTVEKIPPHIPPGLSFTALCYSSSILQMFQKDDCISLIFAGGYYHKASQMFESPEGISLINATRANKLFMSASGVDGKLGITCAYHYEVATKRAAINASCVKILLADSSKFGIVRVAFYAYLSDFDIIVTDKNLSEEWCDYIRGLGVELHLV